MFHDIKARRSILCTLVFVVMLFLAWAAADYSYAGIDGSGTDSDPYDISTGNLEIDADKGGEYWIKGSTDEHHIKIKKKDADDVKEIKLHFTDVTIDLQRDDRGDSKEEPCIRIEENSIVCIYIDNNSETFLTGGNAHGAGRNYGHAAIAVDDGASLDLQVQGSLTAAGGDGGDDRGAAAIGSGDTDNMGSVKCGAMSIHVYDGAYLKATGAKGGAGIGGGNNCGTHDISLTMDGSANVEACGSDGGAGIGGGDDGTVENNIVIKGTGENTQLTASGEDGSAGIGGGSDGSFDSLSIDGIGTLKCTGGKNAAGIGGGDHDSGGSGGNISSVFVTNCNKVEAIGGDGGAGIGGGEDADIYTGVTVENCNEVTATGGKDAAGIGTGRDSMAGVNVNCGDIVVRNSKVTTASSDGNGAGIGCGNSAHVDSISIDGAKDISAAGCGEGSGIGYAGGSVDSGSGSVDKITITNVEGKMTAKAGDNGAGIGLGVTSLDDKDTDMGSIRIGMNGGSLEARAAGTNNAGIGGGKSFGGSEISKIDISGPGTITAKGTAGGSAIGSGDDSNVRNGISIIGPDGTRNLTINVSCYNTDKEAASCPLIGIDDPDDDEEDATDIIIKNAVIKGDVTRADGRNCQICIGGGQHGGGLENPGWINKIDIDNCKITLTGDTGIGIGGNTNVSVGEISIADTDYDGMGIGSMGDPMATVFNGEITTKMKKITINGSTIKAKAKMKKANDGYSYTMSGIGGGNKTYVEEISISDSDITAEGVDGGAGIGGGGYRYDSSFFGDFFTVYGDMGDYFGDRITISGSTIKATGSEGQIYEYDRQVPVLNGEGEIETYDYKTRAFSGCGAGIGGGGFQSVKEIVISDSTVESIGAGTTNYGTWHLWEESIDSGAAGIGGGSMGTAQTITIDKSKVSATGTFGGAGIGTGGKDYQIQQSLLKSSAGDFGLGDISVISITDSPEVTAQGGFYGAGIGGGEKSRIHKINIENSSVKSTGGEGASGIGGGTNSVFAMATGTGDYYDRIGIINIADSIVTAAGGSGGAGIGTGVTFREHSEEGGDRSVQEVRITGSSKVYAYGGEGAAGIGGGGSGNSNLEEFLHWDGGDEMASGNVSDLIISGVSNGDVPLVIASAGTNCVSKDSNMAYATAPADIGRGGDFNTKDKEALTSIDISSGSVYSKTDPGHYNSWTSSYRSGVSVNAFAPDAADKHIDTSSSNQEVYLVRLHVPDVMDHKKVSITVDGDGSTDRSGARYYEDTALYTNTDGMLYLWLRSGEEEKTEADVTVDGTVYHYRGTSRTDNTGMLALCSQIQLQDDLVKIYDGMPIEEPPLKTCIGDGEITYTYYRGDHSDMTPEELTALTSEKIEQDQIIQAGKYTVLAEMSETGSYSAAYDIGIYEILPCDTSVSDVSAAADGTDITLTARVAGLVRTDTDCGTVTFTVTQDGSVVRTCETKVDGDGAASVCFTAPGSAGKYVITASFKCNEEKPNYYDSESDPAEYDRGKLDVRLLPDPDKIAETYGCDPLDLPKISAAVSEEDGAQKAEDEAAVLSGLEYTLIETAAGPVAAFNEAGDKIVVENAGIAILKISFAGNERLNPASVSVPVVIERMPITAFASVSVNHDGEWSEYAASVSTVYGRTAEGDDLRYRVEYYAGEDPIALAGQELAAPIPISSTAAAAEDPYDVPLIKTGTSRNYRLTLGDSAKVQVDPADRELTCSCEDVVYGQIPEPSIVCGTPYDENSLSYHYEGTDNSGAKYDSSVPPAKAGTYTVTAALSEVPGMYNESISEPAAFEIRRADLDGPSVTAENHAYGENLVISVDGNTEDGAVSYTFYRDAQGKIPVTSEDGAAEEGGEPRNAGVYYAVAHIAETEDYNAADTKAGEFRITPREAQVKADDKNKKYGEADPVFTASVTGLLDGDTIKYDISREEGEDSGAYDIIPSGKVLQGNYKVTYANGVLTIGDKYELRFDLNGGTLNGQTGTYTIPDLKYGQEITIPEAPVKKGYKFLYWKGSKYYPGDQYTVASSHNFTAVWKKKAGNDPDDDPSGGGSDDSNGSGGSAAKTGDDNNLLPWGIALIASMLALVILGIRRHCA